MSEFGPAHAALADTYVSEDAVLTYARAQSARTGIRAIGPSGGACLRLLAAALDAKAVAEIGTGTGVSGVYLLRGMRPDGVLTTVDSEPVRQQLAREAYQAAGFAANRSRFIPGRALEVLPRLADGQYDLVFCDGDPVESCEYLREALRLLRPGGMVCFEGVFQEGRLAEPELQDPQTGAVRDLVRDVRESEALLPALLPVSDGLLCAVKR
ncbi:O-methyltransferase [Kitasatospora xanthocidica]|uniref:O-methyltransferase n=1 Tax=Kitasatospora xanthocidica TaxID=83382 RepID=A0A373A4X6_9ACTN|nr:MULTISPECIES: O-methyltransferase [Streptomycetaceae]OKI10871.1 methyltransferase [Streptomyces sp. CB02056]RGD63193.1 O-methyltransferase [Kitasatospora xanthocidica]